MRERRQQQGITVGRRFGDGFGGDIAAGTGARLNDDGLSPFFRQTLAQQARRYVGGPAGGETDDDANRLGRVLLCV